MKMTRVKMKGASVATIVATIVTTIVATIVATILAVGLSVASFAASADEQCFAGSHDSGTLEFSGAVEGSGFTGVFGEFSVGYCMPAGIPADGTIEVLVELASADTDNRERDEALHGEEFFAVEQYPQARWVSTAIAPDGQGNGNGNGDGNGYWAEGELELKGIRASQAIRFTLQPDGDALIARGAFTISGGAEVDRQRFDVGTGEFADPEFVRNRVDVSFDVRLVVDG